MLHVLDLFKLKGNHLNFMFTFDFSAGKAQVVLASIFGLLDGRHVTCGSAVLKRRQGYTEEQASQAPGNVVDLISQRMESYGQELLLKRIQSYNPEEKQFLFVADGDQKVIFKIKAHFILD